MVLQQNTKCEQFSLNGFAEEDFKKKAGKESSISLGLYSKTESVLDLFGSKKDVFSTKQEISFVKQSYCLWVFSFLSYLYNFMVSIILYFVLKKEKNSVLSLLFSFIFTVTFPLTSYFGWHLLFHQVLKHKSNMKYKLYFWQTVFSICISVVSGFGIPKLFTTGVFYNGFFYFRDKETFSGILCLTNGGLFILFSVMCCFFLYSIQKHAHYFV